jgi:putative membrane-bound dehydrogenase-like protein
MPAIMPPARFMWSALFALVVFVCVSAAADGNRFAHLDGSEPFYPHREFPKLTTPQWVGETNVEAVVVLSIDDMRDPAKYEAFLRPILNRLKQVDGRAPLSIFCNALNPAHPQLQAWLVEGLSLEIHTLSHPCPCLAKGDFEAAANTYHGCVDLLNQVAGNKPVAFRMPCCDSMNSPSPRFYAEIFNQTNAQRQFLTIDSSVMNIPTPEDRSLPRELLIDGEGRPRFHKYLPSETNATTRVSMGSFVTTIRDFPYPYVIGHRVWEFPGTLPSDWEAQNLQGVNNPATVADWKAALDVTVLKQGVFNFIFHPHGWVRSDQLVEFIDYAVSKYGSKVKFLNFRETQERLDKFLLGGTSLRDARGEDNRVRLLDLNADGYMDVVIGGSTTRTRLWNVEKRAWTETKFPVALHAGARFGIVEGQPILLSFGTRESGAWIFRNDEWASEPSLLRGLKEWRTSGDKDLGIRLRDVNNDGDCELLIANPEESAIYSWSRENKRWTKLPYSLPPGASFVDAKGNDAGLRFVDFNHDGYDDVIFSNAEAYGLNLFMPKPKEDWRFEVGWTRKVRAGKRADNDPLAIPMIVRGGERRNNGAWFTADHLWLQNEDTAHLPDKVDRRSFQQLLAFDSPAPKSPEEALKTIQVRPGFKVELVAAEPLVMDPVAFDWGADGKLWVVEMGDYPTGLDGEGKPGGFVRYLEDTDNDGRYDKSTVFLDRIPFPTGVMPWRNGILVSAAPSVFYAEDRDGDGKADHRVDLLKGFGEGNQQHRVNGFEYGLDNWVYAANGDSGGTIRSIGGVIGIAPKSRAVNLRGQDFRFQPDSGVFELIEGQTQFGRHRDDWGNWFGNNNPNWGWHYWIPERYARRNEHVAIGSTRKALANYDNSTRVFAISKPLQRFNWPNLVNTLTSANSLTPYRDELFGKDFEDSVFISEPAHNLVHREKLIPESVTFDSRRADDEKDREFLASTDNWFRPTMLKAGPDGALYVADMYRLVIEHTEYALPGMDQQIDVRAGADRGRIYRVFPEEATLRKVPRLDNLSSADLVAALDSSNGWQRDTAQRLLVHRQDKAAIEPLRKLFASSSNAKGRLHALCTLDGLGDLTLNDLQKGWSEPHPMVRVHAVRLSEKLAGNADFSKMFALGGDEDARVRFQLALTLGEPRWEAEAGGRALALIGVRDSNDSYIQTAILSSAPACLDELVKHLKKADSRTTSHLQEQLLQLAIALDRSTATAQLLKEAFGGGSFSMANAFLDGLRRRGESLGDFQKRCSPEVREILAKLPEVERSAANLAFNPQAPANERAMAVRIIGRLSSGDLQRLSQLLLPTEPAALQKATLATFGERDDRSIATTIIEMWPRLAPATRTDALQLFVSNSGWADTLLSAISGDTFPAAQVPADIRQRLLKHRDGNVREKAAKIFGGIANDRQSLIRQFQLNEAGDAPAGLAVFRQQCALCHKFKGEGVALGPDLNGLTDRSVESLLVAILDPNQSVETPFVNYTIATHDGRELSGIIASESGSSVTLRAAGGTEHVLLRKEIKEMLSSGLSLMPEGFEEGITPQQMNDLVHYLMTN